MTADSALMDVTVSKSGTQSPGTCSSICPPTDPGSPRDRAGTPSQGLARAQDPPPTPITNFCIEEILKPGFGRCGSKVKATRPSAFSPWASTGGSVGLANNNSIKNDNNKEANSGSRLLHPALGVMVGKSVGSLSVPFDLSHGSGSAPAWIHRSGNPYPHSPSHSPTESRSAAKDRPANGKCDAHERCTSFTTRCTSIPDLCASIPDRGSSQDSGKDQCATRDVEPKKEGEVLWPAWVYCTRYSDRPSSGRKARCPRSRKIKRHDRHIEEKRPRTAFTNEQLSALKREFDENRYLTEERRQRLATELHLNESQIKIWFQNKRAKLKKASGQRNGLALQLMAQGLYNHSTIPIHEDDNSDDSKTS